MFPQLLLRLRPADCIEDFPSLIRIGDLCGEFSDSRFQLRYPRSLPLIQIRITEGVIKAVALRLERFDPRRQRFEFSELLER